MGNNTVSNWDSAKWNDGFWSKYQATWGNGVWEESFWNFVWMDTFRDVITRLEKVNVGEYLFEPGVCVPGLDNFKSKFKDVLEKLEK